MVLPEITAGKVNEYRIHRLEECKAKRGKPPAHNTMHQEIVTLRQIFKTALRHGWIDHLPDLSAPYRRSGIPVSSCAEPWDTNLRAELYNSSNNSEIDKEGLYGFAVFVRRSDPSYRTGPF